MAVGNFPTYILKIHFNNKPNLTGGLSSKIFFLCFWANMVFNQNPAYVSSRSHLFPSPALTSLPSLFLSP